MEELYTGTECPKNYTDLVESIDVNEAVISGLSLLKYSLISNLNIDL